MNLDRWATCLHDRHDFESAINVLSSAIQLDATEVVYWINRGVAKTSLRRFDDAIADLTHAIDLAPTKPLAHAHRGIAYSGKEMFEDALENLSHYPCEGDNDAAVALLRGHVREQLCDWNGAVKDYELAHELDPSMTEAMVGLAILQAACPEESFRDGHQAVKNAHRLCVSSDWRDWRALSVLAAGYAEVGDFESAIRYAQQTLKLAPENEKETRRSRVRQYENSIPLRLPLSDDK